MWKEIRRNYRRLVASLLTMVMVATNVGGNLETVFAAGETENALFLVEGKALRDAIREAVEQGETFSFSSLELAARKKSIRNKYEEFLGKKKSRVYELDLDIDSSYAPEGTSLQIFYQEGTKDVIFLFLNENDMAVDYRVNIDGYETKPVTVNPNTANIDADEEELPAYAENYEAADMIDDVVEKPKAETLAPQEPEESEAEAGDSSQVEEESSTAEETMNPGEAEETKPDELEDSENAEPVKPEESTEIGSAEPEEAGEETEEITSDIEESETVETKEETEEAGEAEETLSGEKLLEISGHKAALVAVSAEIPEQEEMVRETETEAEPDEEEEAGEETAETEKVTETELDEEAGSETETESEAEQETEPEKETENGTEDTVTDEDSSEAEKESETESENESETEKGSAPETGTEETEKGSAPETGTEETEKGSAPETETEETESGTAEETESETGEEVTGKIEMEGQALEGDEIEYLGELKGKALDTATIKNHVNVKAVKVSWEDIAEIIESEYLVDYMVKPMEGAEIVGADYVAGGADLYFAVETEEEYEIVSVTANGEELEPVEEVMLASDSNAGERYDWKNYSYVYAVKQVSSDLEIVVELYPDIELAVLRSPALESAIALLDALPETEEVYGYQPEIDINEEEDPQGYTKAYWESIQKYLTELGGQVKEAREAYENLAEEEKEAVSLEKTEKLEELETLLAEFVIPELSLLNLENTAAVIGEGEAMRGYETLQAAVDEVKEGETISLLKDVSQSVVSENKTYTLNMNGMTIGAIDNAGSTYTIRGGDVTLINGVIRGVRKESGAFSVKGAGLHVENAKLRAEGVRISWENGDGQKLVIDISKFNSTQQRGYSFMGGGIYAEDSNLELDQCVITGNGGEIRGSINIYGGGIYIKGGSLSMDGCEISENYLELNTTSKSYYPYGGGIYAEGAALKLTETSVSGNTAEHKATSGYGTAIYLEGSTLTGEGLTINGNKSINPVVKTKNSDLALKKVHMSENEGVRAIYMETGKLNLEEAEIDGSGITLTEVSGRLYDTTIQKSSYSFWVKNATETENLSFDKVRIRGNTDGVWIETKGEFHARDCVISNNEVVYSAEKNIISFRGSGEKTLENCTVSDNVCLYTGSSNLNRNSTIHVNLGTSLTIKGGRIENNRARGAGAILNGGAVKANISDETEAGTKEAQKATVIQGNTSDYAGAIYNTGSMELNHTIIKNNTSTAQLSSESVGGVYSSGALFALNSGALYGNVNEDEKNKFTSAQDLLIKANKTARVLPAAQMYDPEVADAGYFADYRWIDVSKISNKVETGGLEGVKPLDGKYKAIVYDDREIVAKVGEEGFSTLKEALQKVKSGGRRFF